MSELIKGIKTKNGFNPIDYLSLANKPSFDLVASYRKAGAYTWTCPEDGEYIALIIGGGGSGCAYALSPSSDHDWTHKYGCGGKHGEFNIVRTTYTSQKQIPIVIGAGGEAVSFPSEYAHPNYGGAYGNAGGTSSFDGVTAEGGGEGRYGYSDGINWTPRVNLEATLHGWIGIGTFLDEKGMPVTMLSDGGDVLIEDGYASWLQSLPSFNDGILSPGVYAKWNNSPNDPSLYTAITPTDCGAGSGAVFGNFFQSSNSPKLQGAPGADGGVFIYKVR